MLARWNDRIRQHPGLTAGVLFAITAVVFQGILGGAFLFDDVPLIAENRSIIAPGHWKQLLLGSIWSSRGAVDSGHFYRPLQMFAYWLLYRMDGPNPVLFHLLQLAVYGGAVCMAFSLGRRLLRNDLAAFAGALLWALHPLHVEAVAWISALGEVASGLLVMLSFSLFLRAESCAGRRAATHLPAACVYVAALLCKEMAIGLPLLILVYWFFLGGKESWAPRLVRWLPHAVGTAGYLALRVFALGRYSTAPQPLKLSLTTFASAIGLLGEHTKLLLWPLHLTTARSFELSASLHSPWPWVALLAGLVAFARGRRQPLLSFLVVWWMIVLLPALDIRQLVGAPVGDRFSYLPSLGPCLAIAFGAFVLLPAGMPRSNLHGVLAPALLVIACLWTLQDLRSIPHWRSEDALWSHAASVAPDSAFSHRFRAMSLEYETGNLDGAAREYQSAIHLSDANSRRAAGFIYECDLGLGRIALRKGQVAEAIADFQAAIDLDPNVSQAYQSLGTLYLPRGDYAAAAPYFLRAVQVDPQDLEARFFLGTCWMKLGKPAQAAEEFRAAGDIDPSFVQAFRAEAQALEASGDLAGAARVRQLANKN